MFTECFSSVDCSAQSNLLQIMVDIPNKLHSASGKFSLEKHRCLYEKGIFLVNRRREFFLNPSMAILKMAGPRVKHRHEFSKQYLYISVPSAQNSTYQNKKKRRFFIILE